LGDASAEIETCTDAHRLGDIHERLLAIDHHRALPG
jgi:hypothetical protein